MGNMTNDTEAKNKQKAQYYQFRSNSVWFSYLFCPSQCFIYALLKAKGRAGIQCKRVGGAGQPFVGSGREWGFREDNGCLQRTAHAP